MRRLWLIVPLLFASAGIAGAVPSSGCSPSTAFENDEVRIWFQGFKGHIKVTNNADGGTSYDLKTLALTENSGGEAVSSLNLERAYPQDTETCTVVTDEDGVVTLTFGVTAGVRAVGQADAQGGNTIGDATLRYVFHFDPEDNGSKFDLFVDEWPWTTEDGELAFSFGLEAPDATIEAAENGVGFRDGDGNARGYISWDPEFTTRYEDGHEETGVVDGDTHAEGSSAEVSLNFTEVTSGFDELEYDPWMGVGDYLVIGPLLISLDSLLALLPV
jgi:hypothetical protein